MYADTVRPSLRAARIICICCSDVTRMFIFLSFNFGSLVVAVCGWVGLVYRRFSKTSRNEVATWIDKPAEAIVECEDAAHMPLRFQGVF